MPWKIEYIQDLDAVRTVYSGVLPPEKLVEAVQSTIQAGKEYGVKKFLADCSTLEGGHSIFDLYDLAKLLDVSGVPQDFCEALVLPQLDAAAEDVRFWETTCRNRGFEVRIFNTVAEATAWLGRVDIQKEGSEEDSRI